MQPPTASNSIQYIGEVSARGGSQVAAGTFHGNVTFVTGQDPKERAAEEARNSLFLSDPSIDRAELRSSKGERVAGTCEWIKDTANYQSWLKEETRLLWIRGSPGKGKTVLAIFLSDEQERLAQASVEREVIYYFCSSERASRNNVNAILRGLLWQVLSRRPELTKCIVQYVDTQEKKDASLNSKEALWTMFMNVMVQPNFTSVHCVLDGLDECDEDSQRWLAGKIRSVLSAELSDRHRNTCAMKMIVLSRDIPTLRPCATQINLDVDYNGEVRNDISKFVAFRVEELATYADISAIFRQTIEHQLLERSEGTFLWVGFAIVELMKKKTSIQIEQTLQSLPKGLPAIYNRLVYQIDPLYRATCSNILCWIATAVRPLSFDELAAAIGTEPSALLSQEQVVRDHVTLCGSFLSVGHDRVSLTHQSVRDYLLRHEAESDVTLEQFRVKPAKAHLELAWSCLQYMKDTGLQNATLDLDLKAYRSLSRRYPLLSYGVVNWSVHATYNDVVAEDLLQHPSLFFDKDSTLRAKWWLIYTELDPRVQDIDVPILHMASYLGLVAWARELLRKKTLKWWIQRAVNTADSRGTRPLHYAAWQGQQSVLRFLLEQGAQVNSTDQFGRTILHWTCGYGQRAMVQLLLGSGADVNAQDQNGRNALNEAVANGQEPIARLLLDQGANVNAVDLDGNTVLLQAVRRGDVQMANLILRRGADIYFKEWNGRTLLYTAASNRNGTMTRLLVDFGMSVNYQDNLRDTVLHIAALDGDEAMVRTLLDLGADPNLKDGLGWTPVHNAAWKGNSSVVRALLDRGAGSAVKSEAGGQGSRITELDDDVLSRLS